MACNLNEDRKFERSGGETAGSRLDGGEGLSSSSTTPSKQNGDQAADEQPTEQDACDRRRSALSDGRTCTTSPGTLPKSADEWSRRSFQIPRRIKERRGVLQSLTADSREFEDLIKVLSSSYLDSSSRVAFTYTKASLIHNELLEKEFIEKKRELKQAGRTDAELTDSYAFLLAEPNKTHLICEKGLSVGHARISNLGVPTKGCYLSKYSDLLQMNPFEAGASGDIIIFKVMKGKMKSIFENTPKGNVEPSIKFDSHVHKNSCKVTSLLSYRAFELTQQYFYEFAFEELRSRPRHVCPYAVVSFQYKGKESATGTHRLSNAVFEGHKGRRKYTVWTGSLVNKGEELYQVSIRSASVPFLPFKLPDQIDISVAMHLDQLKRKIPSTLLSWDTYCGTEEAMKCGMYCSLFEVIAKSKQSNTLTGLLHKMEKDKMVFVKPLVERGFLFLLLSSHLHSSVERRGRNDRGLLALFVCQESRITSRFMSRHCVQKDDPLVLIEPKDPITEHLDTFVPALHHALFKLRSSPPKNLAGAVKAQALDYLVLKDQGLSRPFAVPDYRLSHDERPNPYTPTRPKSLNALLNTYIHAMENYQLAVDCLHPVLTDSAPAVEDEYSPVSDWSGSGSTKPTVAQSNGSGAQKCNADYDKEKMQKLLQLIQMHKRAIGKDEVQEPTEDWEQARQKRRFEGEGSGGVNKYLKTANLINGEPERVPQADQSLLVADSMGLCDTDLRQHDNQNVSIQDAQTLLKIFLTAFKKIGQNSATATGPTEQDQLPQSVVPDQVCEPNVLGLHSEHNLPSALIRDERVIQDFLEDQMACSVGSMDLCSPSSSTEQQLQNLPDPNQIYATMSTAPTDSVLESGTLGTDISTQVAGSALDFIVEQEYQSLCTGIHRLMNRQKIAYVSQPSLPRNEVLPNRLDCAFSPYILNYTSPLPVQSYVNSLCEKMNKIINRSARIAAPIIAPQVAPATPPQAPHQMDTSFDSMSPVAELPIDTSPDALHPYQSAPKSKSRDELPKPPSMSLPFFSNPATPPLKKQPSPVCKLNQLNVKEEKNDTKLPDVSDIMSLIGGAGQLLIPETSCEPAQPGASENVISQIKPDVLCTLVEIMQMNAVRFYIQLGDDEEENQLFSEIKGYLESLGNIECSPVTYLKNNCQQKFMVIIQNKDIASHVHKIPALVSLKKMSNVYFAGVDSLDDVKNRTYNELFVSGGLIVSDELTLNPDFITMDKLQRLLCFLDEQSGSWRWKVHCKTQKKLKELSRLNSKALELLNLLTAYQKKHVVEFLPYHECDSPSRQAPNVDCLVKLQTHNTQLRHIVYLTDKCEEASRFSSNGIIAASLNDILDNFQSLISCVETVEVPTVPIGPASVEPDACMDEEDMSIDSEEEPAEHVEDKKKDEGTVLTQPPKTEEIPSSLPEPACSHPETQSACPVDYNALKEAISNYKAAKQAGANIAEGEESLASFGVNPHQSYLFPNSTQWSPYSCSPSFLLNSVFSLPACPASQGQDYSQMSSMGSGQTSIIPLSQNSSANSFTENSLVQSQISTCIREPDPEATPSSQTLSNEGQLATQATESDSLSASALPGTVSTLPDDCVLSAPPPILSVPPPILSVPPPVSTIAPPVSTIAPPVSTIAPPISTVPPPIPSVPPPNTAVSSSTPSISPPNTTVPSSISSVPPSIPSVSLSIPSVPPPIPSVSLTIPSVLPPIPSVSLTIPSVVPPIPSILPSIPPVPPPILSVPPPIPSVSLPITSVPPPILSVPPPILSVPPPILSVPPPILSIPPPILSVPPPNLSVPPPNFSVPPPNLSVPPPILSVPPPNLSVPPPILSVPSCVPPMPTGFTWGASADEQNDYAALPITAPFTNNEGSTSTETSLDKGKAAAPNDEAEEGMADPVPSSAPVQTEEAENTIQSSVNLPPSQTIRTPVNSCYENQRGSTMPAMHYAGDMPNRGGFMARGLLPCPGDKMPPMFQGRMPGPNLHCGNRPFGPRGPMPGPADMARGGFRGRGMPPMPMRSRPVRGSMWGGPPFNRGFRGPARGYY